MTRGRVSGGGNQRWLSVLAGVLCFLSLTCDRSIPEDAPEEIERMTTFHVAVDGDTIRTPGGQLIRLIGVDAPEKDGPHTEAEPGWRKAKTFVETFFEDSATVYLAFDHKRYDDHDRLLAYVYRAGDYRMLNRALLEEGRARAYRKYSYQKKEEFLKLESEAKKREKGIWAGLEGREK